MTEKITIAEYRRLIAKKKRGAARRSFCLLKHFHPSYSEAEYCNWLLALKRGGEIKDFKLYPKVDLHINGKLWRSWAIDFLVIEKHGGNSYHEVKGHNLSDANFKLKLSAFRLEYPDIPIYVNKIRITSDGWKRNAENQINTGKIFNTRSRRLRRHGS